MTPHRSLNVCEAFIGVPGTGKSTNAAALLMEFHLRERAHVFIHDTGWNVPDRLPMELGGGNCGIIRHESFESCASRIARDARGLHAFHKQSVTEVIQFARKVARASLQAGGGNQGYPVIVYIDEVVLSSDMTPNKLSPEIKTAFTQRRHDHVGYVWSTQQPNQIHPQCLMLSKKLHIFRCPGEYAAQRFRAAGCPRELIADIQKLPDHKYIDYEIGREYVGDSGDEDEALDADPDDELESSESPAPSESDETNTIETDSRDDSPQKI